MSWPLQSECAHLFGNPSAPGWGRIHLAGVAPPYPMHMGDIPIRSIQINRVCADSLARVLNSFFAACDHDPGKVAAEHGDIFSGSWVVRSMRGKNVVSMHSYGLAIDFNAPMNPLAKAPGVVRGSFRASSLLVKAFEAEGWVWGGRWKGRPDPMHFQAAIVG